MKTLIFLMAFALLSVPVAGACETQNQITPLTSVKLADGREVLGDTNRLSAYVFDVDQDGISACYDDCASAWPAILASEGQTFGADVATTLRNDGSLQLTYKGRPVYLFVGDGAEGKINNKGLGGVWHLVQLN
jgi:predicted lipoprotein with Yx(FWY)xxD motif